MCPVGWCYDIMLHTHDKSQDSANSLTSCAESLPRQSLWGTQAGHSSWLHVRILKCILSATATVCQKYASETYGLWRCHPRSQPKHRTPQIACEMDKRGLGYPSIAGISKRGGKCLCYICTFTNILRNIGVTLYSTNSITGYGIARQASLFRWQMRRRTSPPNCCAIAEMPHKRHCRDSGMTKGLILHRPQTGFAATSLIKSVKVLKIGLYLHPALSGTEPWTKQ